MEHNSNLIENHLDYFKSLEFKEAFPWIGGDLQTIKDTFHRKLKKPNKVKRIYIPITDIFSKDFKGEYLLGILEIPSNSSLKGIVVITHGLGGSTRRFGLRRISEDLRLDGFAVLKLNLRGAGSGRYLSRSNYCARCSDDIFAVIKFLRKNIFLKEEPFFSLKEYIPVYAVGLSLGGTILLNACLDYKNKKPLLDGLACVSSPLDLLSCSECIQKKRNYFYQKWLIHRLKNQLLEGGPLNHYLNLNLSFEKEVKSLNTIREFDEKFTAPSWGYKSVEDYYFQSSPINKLKNNGNNIPSMLLIHSKDDPWVPYNAIHDLANSRFDSKNKIKTVITDKGGHNGFHSKNGCWSDEVVKNWLNLF